EWEIFLRLVGLLSGQGSDANVNLVDDFSVITLIEREVGMVGSQVEGRDAGELLEALKPRRGPERMLDFLLRSGPYGDGFDGQDGLSMATLEAHPHGVDLGPLQPRIPEILRTASGKIELAPQPMVEDVERLRASLEKSM